MDIIRKIDHLDKKLFYLLYVYYREHYALDLLLFYFTSAYYEFQIWLKNRTQVENYFTH